jgi:hypothetical protein
MQRAVSLALVVFVAHNSRYWLELSLLAGIITQRQDVRVIFVRGEIGPKNLREAQTLLGKISSVRIRCLSFACIGLFDRPHTKARNC